MPSIETSFVERRDPALLTPEYEDAGLFKSDILQLDVGLTPILTRNSRRDVIVRCYCDASRSFEITFAGRRSQMAAPLMACLAALEEDAGADVLDDSAAQPDLTALRFPVTVEGAWRRRFWINSDGWLMRVHQFVAARWTVVLPLQRPILYGLPAVIGPQLPGAIRSA